MISEILQKIAKGELITMQEAEELKAWADGLQNAPELFGQLFKGLSNISNLAQITHDMGTVNRGVFISGDNGDFLDTSGNDPFTGVVMMSPGISVDSGNDEASLFGMNAGSLQFWLSNLTGKIFGGGGAVTVDGDGITITSGVTGATDVNWIKFLNGTFVDAWIVGIHSSGGDSSLHMNSASESGNDDDILIQATAAGAADVASVEITARNLAGTGNQATLDLDTGTPQTTWYLIDNSTPTATISMASGLIQINANADTYGGDTDTVIRGTTDDNVIYVDAGNNRAGIGTSTPTTKLDVVGTVTADGADIDGATVINESGADVDTRIEGDTDTALVFVDAGNDRVGIGDSTPSYKLDVNGDVNIASGSDYLKNGSAINVIPVIGNALNNTVPASTTEKHLPYTTVLGSSNFNAVFPRGGTLSNLDIRTNSSQPASGSMVVTVFVNGSSSALTLTIAASDPAGTFQDNSNTVAISDGDRVRVEFQNNAGSASAQVGAISFLLTY